MVPRLLYKHLTFHQNSFMLNLDQPINLEFVIPAADPLGREEVAGKLRFLPQGCELHWALTANVFRGGKGEHQVIHLPYNEIDEVELQKKWLRPTKISFHVSNPELIKDIPGVVMGNLTFEIEKRSKEDLERLKSFIDFKQSLFLFEQNDAYLKEMKGDK